MLIIANPQLYITEKPPPNDSVALDIRLCKECNHTIFASRDFQASLSSVQVESFTRSYSNLLQFERGIRLLMPKFQKLLQALQDPDHPPSSQQITDASRTRKRLMDSFTQYDTAARRIRDMPSQSPTQLKLQKAIYQNSMQFLHLHMLPLKALPKVLKHATPHGSSQKPDLHSDTNPRTSLAILNGPNTGHVRQNSSSALSVTSFTSINSARISELEGEEKSIRERLIVLEEQKFLVQEMIADANRRRKFDEVAALAGNVEDLAAEIDSVMKLVEGVRGEFAGLYGASGLGSGVVSPQRRDSGMGKGKHNENG